MARTHFHALLEAKVQAAIEKMALSVADGFCEDFPKYRYYVGYLQGLRDSLKLCDEIEEEMNL